MIQKKGETSSHLGDHMVSFDDGPSERFIIVLRVMQDVVVRLLLSRNQKEPHTKEPQRSGRSSCPLPLGPALSNSFA